ncbi:MAG: FtsX-like permease family protein, partial [Bifidobacteriaceae bacterium]|nr:FtsX-like permease family protein [Bifidobacteriaceae bacterium]
GSQNIKDNIGFVQNFIIIFAIIALFVGCFIIANTFSMIVHESLREYALLRAIGASSSQVFQTVILQAVVIGIFGSVLGLLLGTGLVQIIPIVLKYMGASIDQVVFPNGEQIAIVLGIGLFISLFAAVFPARKAGSTPPVAAMSEAVLPSSLGIVRTAFGSLFFIIGLPPLIAINNYDWFVNTFNTHILDDYKSWAAGIGASAIALSALLLGPLIIRPIVWLLSSPIVWVSRVGGKLARNNILRNFKSSANTASALLIGIALVSCCCVLASSASASVASIVSNNVKSDLIVMDENMKLPTSVIDKVKDEPGINSVNELYLTQLKVDKDNLPVISVGDTFFDKDIDTQGFDYTGDPLYSIEHGEAVIPKTIADSQGYKMGDTIVIRGVDTKKMDERKEKIKEAVEKEAAAFAMKNMRAPTSQDIQKIQEAEVKKQGSTLPTKEYKYTVGSIVDLVLLPGVLVNNKEFNKLTISDQRLLFRLFVTLEPGQNLEIAKANLQNKVKDYYTVSVLDKSGVNNLVAGIVNQILALLYGLLALSIFIALLGIINTLTLSVVQRTREIGLLRAVGLSNGGLTIMLALESLLIALFGTILGIAIGVNAAVAIQKSLQSSGFSTLSIPWQQIGMFIAITVIFALIACLFPARRAKKMPVLDAISAE